MHGVLTDLRWTLRSLQRSPGITAAAVVACALTLATAGTVFSIAYAVLLRPLPFADSDRLYWVWATRVDRDRAFFSLPDFVEHEAATARMVDLVALANWGANLSGTTEPQRLQGLRATGNLTAVLGFAPALGRSLAPQDDQPSSPVVVVLSYALWQRQFGADPAIVGRVITLNDQPYIIVGVLPRDFVLPGMTADVVIALRPRVDPRRMDRETNFLRVIARLHPGVNTRDTLAALAAVTSRLRDEFPASNAKKTDPRLVLLSTELIGQYRAALTLLLLCAALILMLTTANLAQLLLARLGSAMHATAIRLALGASPARATRLLLAEPLAIAVSASALGLGLMLWLLPVARRLLPDVPRAANAGVDAATISAVLIAGLCCGVTAFLPAARRLLGTARVSSLLGSPAVTRPSRAGTRLLAAELALCLALVATALLAAQSVAALLRIETGISAHGVTTARISLPPSRYDAPALDRFVRAWVTDLHANPDVAAAALTNVVPLSAMNVRTDFTIEGRSSGSAKDVPGAQNRWITPDYFRAMGIPIVRGRAFSEDDARTARRVVIVDTPLARQFWAGRDPLGDRLHMLGLADDPWTVVGVAGGVKHQSVDEEPAGTLYAPLAQTPASSLPFVLNSLSAVVRGRVTAPERLERIVRASVRAQDPAVPMSAVRSVQSLIDASLAARRLTQWVMSALAIVAIAISIFGIAAVTANLVASRRREFAIRLAIGASPARVWRQVVIEIGRVAAIGTAIGAAAGAALALTFRHVFYGVAPIEPLRFAGAALIVLSAAVAGGAVPAWRASRVDAALTLKHGS